MPTVRAGARTGGGGDFGGPPDFGAAVENSSHPRTRALKESLHHQCLFAGNDLVDEICRALRSPPSTCTKLRRLSQACAVNGDVGKTCISDARPHSHRRPAGSLQLPRFKASIRHGVCNFQSGHSKTWKRARMWSISGNDWPQEGS